MKDYAERQENGDFKVWLNHSGNKESAEHILIVADAPSKREAINRAKRFIKRGIDEARTINP